MHFQNLIEQLDMSVLKDELKAIMERKDLNQMTKEFFNFFKHRDQVHKQLAT